MLSLLTGFCCPPSSGLSLSPALWTDIAFISVQNSCRGGYHTHPSHRMAPQMQLMFPREAELERKECAHHPHAFLQDTGMCRNLAMCQLNSLAAHADWAAPMISRELGSERACELRMQMSSLPPQPLSQYHLFRWFQVTQPLDRPEARLGLPPFPYLRARCSQKSPFDSKALRLKRIIQLSCPSQNSLLFWETIAGSSMSIEHNLRVKLRSCECSLYCLWFSL